MRVSLITIIILLLIFQDVLLKMIKLDLKYNESFCFTQDIPKHVLVKFTSSSTVNFLTQITYGRNQIYREISENAQKHFTTQQLGIYRFCFTNNINRNPINITFDLLTGLKANDYGSHNHQDQISQIKRMADLAQKFVQDIQSQNQQAIMISSKSFKSPVRHNYPLIFSIFFIIVTLVLSVIQYKMIYKVLIVRKYI